MEELGDDRLESFVDGTPIDAWVILAETDAHDVDREVSRVEEHEVVFAIGELDPAHGDTY